jgi:predicted NBD/HSP70 family sugar kinase
VTISLAATEIAVGIDVGGTNCTTCAIDRDGTMLGALSHPTPQTDDGEALLSALADTAQQLIARLELRSVAGIGIGVPGRTVSACPPGCKTTLTVPHLLNYAMVRAVHTIIL